MTFEEGVNEITNSILEMFRISEEYFGECERKWFFVGIEFKDDGPYIMYYPSDKISIVLSTGSTSNFEQLYYQLAHEVCHLLYPSGKPNANVLIEGISTYFSLKYNELKFSNSTYAIDNIKKSNYYNAYLLVDKLLSFDKDAIKKIRMTCSDISNITEDDLRNLSFNLSEVEIKKLVSKF